MAATYFTEVQLEQMLELARRSLLSAFDLCPGPESPDWLVEPGACFVTLTRGGQLRGCIGTLESHRSLGLDLIANARNSAFSDPRFNPVTRDELEDMVIEISILTPASPMTVESEASLLEQLRPGVDGLILMFGHHRATFLPTVWDQLQTPVEFVAALKRKAGLSADTWSPDMRWSRYETQHAEGRLLQKR